MTFWAIVCKLRKRHAFKRARKGQDKNHTHCRCGETRPVKHRTPKEAS